MQLFGLIGKPLAQSFSKKYFTQKFQDEKITGAAYELFQLEDIHQLQSLLASHPNLRGLNVTIPYKEQVIAYLYSINEDAKKIAACNCIKIHEGKLIGYNTDAPAFEESFAPLLKSYHKKALILGTGGAAKAVLFVLNKLGIQYTYVSRKAGNGLIYEALNEELMQEYKIIINTTPLGSFPNVENAPAIPYNFITNQHYLYDLVYNPDKTLFLQRGEERGATIKNGYQMLVGQAELSWKIWNDDNL